MINKVICRQCQHELTELTEEDKYCYHCGAEIISAESTEPSTIESEKLVCQNCQAQLSDQDRYCYRCGSAVSDEAMSEPITSHDQESKELSEQQQAELADEQQDQIKKRVHPIAVIYCIIGILSSLYLIYNSVLLYSLTMYSVIAILIIASVLLLIGYVLILRLQKFGFYILVSISVLSFFTNLALTNGYNSEIIFFQNIGSLVLLYFVLQIGGENSTWKNMSN